MTLDAARPCHANAACQGRFLWRLPDVRPLGAPSAFQGPCRDTPVVLATQLPERWKALAAEEFGSAEAVNAP